MKKLSIIFLLLVCIESISQTKNFIDVPHLQTTAKVDTLVIPDRIYLNISISEKDTKGKISVEELENKMNEKLKSIGINTSEQLTLNDLATNFTKYFLKQQEIVKAKEYMLLVYDAITAGKVIIALEEIGVSNVVLKKTEYSKTEEMILILKSKAVEKAKKQAIALTKPLNMKVGDAIYIADNIYRAISANVSSYSIRGTSSIMEKDSDKFAPILIEFEKIKIETEIIAYFKIE